ncbi:PD-(D/E)XK nuclease family protein [Lentilactobacillus farraginis]|uniref:ATP-dependent helicase/deoxyribonuclease subunit B n=1 Tax=Lentilactobacillus farraginis DSM 18382 = JCM 14108 TaxID=1423743 RepID=X0PBS0_9LACO|nr:PD-(D/E)XK nuclease family protein [Lentilactobacillus farraginis]GAF37699.1 ATP-dependent nuclease, subunit B [Lentilactobacillus farraginis DSM 18382 = JCM 14108]
MTLQFVLGTNGADHQGKMVEILQKQRAENPNDRFFYLVPNHIKFESEVEILKQLADPTDRVTAQSSVQVLSFTRLAWYFLRTTAKYQKQRISPAGINMLLYQIITDRQDDLLLFSQEARLPGFIDQIAKQISAMQAGNVLPEDLMKMNESPAAQLSNDLRDKLHDFAIIYADYHQRIDDQYFDNHDVLNLLSDYLAERDLTNYHFYISGFSKFTAQECRLVETLTKRGASMTISLILDKPYRTALPTQPNLFYQSGKLFYRLYRFAADQKIPYLPAVVADQPRLSSDLLKLEKFWIQSSGLGAITADNTVSPQSIQIFQADNPYAELDQVAARIRQMVSTGKYRYSDFLILTRRLDSYATILDPVFTMQGIPYFKDIQKSMVDHPLVDLLSSLFDIYDHHRLRNYRYDDVMRFLKSELVLPRNSDGTAMKIDDYRRAVALTENLVLKNGFEGQKWTQAEDWQYVWVADDDDGTILTDRDKEITRQINVIRHLVKDTLPKFYRRLYRAKTNADAATALYHFLVETGVVQRLQQLRNAAVDQQEINRSDEIEQVWRTFCSLLDECVQILGDRPFDAQDFWALIYAGFEGASYSQIPSTLDQVQISESGMVQMANRKVTIMIGSNDETMPERIVNDSLFGDDDLVQIQDNLNDDQYLNDPADELMADEPYLNYLAFTSSSSRLIFSYTSHLNDETDVNLSPYVTRIAAHFNLQITHHAAVPDNQTPVAVYIGTKRATLHHLIQVVQDTYKNKGQLNATWTFIFNQLKHDPEIGPLTDQLLGSIDYKNVPVPLSQEIAEKLYGSALNISISQLESFYENPYEYFLKYGLRLQEREQFELSPASTGQFFHEALDRIISMVHEQKIDLADLNDADVNELVAENVAAMVADPDNFQYVILNSSNRMHYITMQLEATIQQMIRTIRDQQKLTPMRPQKTELVFGQPSSKGLKGLSFELPNHKQVNVRGRIDRIDAMKVNNKRYFGIVDYKSSNKKFDFNQAYIGTSMQLLTYLDVLRENLAVLNPDTSDALLAGALYMHIFNATFKPDDFQKGLEKSLLTKHKYQGILVDDADLVDNLDTDLANGSGHSLVYPFNKLKSGSVGKASSTITENDLNAFLDRTESLIVDASTRIFNGDTSLAPVKIDQFTPMQFTPYKAIMNFDPLLPENNYRLVPKHTKKEIIDKLRGEKQ